MNSIPDELIYMISIFCDDRSNFLLSLVCRNTHNALKKRGYARHITFDYIKNDISTFTERFYSHYRTINSCSMMYLKNAFIWLPLWVDHVFLYNCYIDQDINPTQIVPTKKLWIQRDDYTLPLTINWQKFPYLEEIYIKNYDVNTSDLRICKKLKKIKIKLKIT